MALTSKSLNRLSKRDREIREKEEQLENMMQELSSKQTIRDKLAVSFKYKDITPKYETSPVRYDFEEENVDKDEEIV